MKVKIKLVHKSIKTSIPKYSRDGDAALDLVATSVKECDDYIQYGTNLRIEIPSGHVGLIFPRSSISICDLSLCNSVGVIDENYRGEIMLRFNYLKTLDFPNDPLYYSVGDRIGQLMVIPIPKVELELVDELDPSNRGENGFGSSGK